MSTASTIEIQVNGEARLASNGTTVAQLLAELGATGKRVAVERNGEIVPRSLHAGTRVEAGDRIEVVVAVGGG
jgi:sulfur carrier protein